MYSTSGFHSLCPSQPDSWDIEAYSGQITSKLSVVLRVNRCYQLEYPHRQPEVQRLLVTLSN